MSIPDLNRCGTAVVCGSARTAVETNHDARSGVRFRVWSVRCPNEKYPGILPWCEVSKSCDVSLPVLSQERWRRQNLAETDRSHLHDKSDRNRVAFVTPVATVNGRLASNLSAIFFRDIYIRLRAFERKLALQQGVMRRTPTLSPEEWNVHNFAVKTIEAW